MKNRKSIGIGSLSFIIFIIAIIFSFNTKNRSAIGDQIFMSLGLKAWSNGTNGFHYTILGTIILLMVAWLIGNRYKNHLGAVLARKLSMWLGLILVMMMLGSVSIWW